MKKLQIYKQTPVAGKKLSQLWKCSASTSQCLESDSDDAASDQDLKMPASQMEPEQISGMGAMRDTSSWGNEEYGSPLHRISPIGSASPRSPPNPFVSVVTPPKWNISSIEDQRVKRHVHESATKLFH